MSKSDLHGNRRPPTTTRGTSATNTSSSESGRSGTTNDTDSKNTHSTTQRAARGSGPQSAQTRPRTCGRQVSAVRISKEVRDALSYLKNGVSEEPDTEGENARYLRNILTTAQWNPEHIATIKRVIKNNEPGADQARIIVKGALKAFRDGDLDELADLEADLGDEGYAEYLGLEPDEDPIGSVGDMLNDMLNISSKPSKPTDRDTSYERKNR